MKTETIAVTAIPGVGPFHRVFMSILDTLKRIGGPDLIDVLSVSATLDFTSIAAGASQTKTIALVGIKAGEPVVVGVPAAVGNADLIAYGYVSAINTVSVMLHNPTGSAIDPASAVYRATVFRYA